MGEAAAKADRAILDNPVMNYNTMTITRGKLRGRP
jgi:hypothetical protein